MRYNNGPQSAASMVASYGVYNDTGLRISDEDDDGFLQQNSQVYRGVVVNASGDSTVVRSGHMQDTSVGAAAAAAVASTAPVETNSCGWCLNTQSSATTTSPSSRDSCLISWCRPTILLLILVLLVVVFVLVSGILLYYNCTFQHNYPLKDKHEINIFVCHVEMLFIGLKHCSSSTHLHYIIR